MSATLTSDRQTYRELVAQVAAKAKAILPVAVNGRVESAVKLVLAGDVEPLDDGTVRVGSSSDPERYHLLMGQTCTCQDFAHGKAPEGWCQHRIAAGLHKRVRELLAQAAPVPQEPASEHNTLSLGEAPASCNVYLSIGGHRVQVTLRDTNEQRMLERLQALLDRYPAPAQPADDTRQCPVHGVPMRQTSKNGRTWWSHRTADGQWCKGQGGRYGHAS